MIALIKDWYIKRRVYRQTENELYKLTPHELNDLGLSRDMIPMIAFEAAYGVKQ
jgi:uncharacterized protein YjiS (DUF1127 family)